MKKKNLLFVIRSANEGSVYFLKSILSRIDCENYIPNVLSLKDDFETENENVKVRKISSNSYLDRPFGKALKKCLKNRKISYIPLLVWEKITKKQNIRARMRKVRIDGKYRAVYSLDLESCSYAPKIADGKIFIQRFPFASVPEPYEDDYRALKKYDFAVCQNENVARNFAKTYRFSEEKIKIVPDTLSPEYFREKADEYVTEKKAKYSFAVLCPLTHIKETDFICETSKSLINRHLTDFKFTVIYDGEDFVSQNMKIKKQKLDNFIELKKSDNPMPYIKACDIYIHLGETEGENYNIICANALGKPVLSVKTEFSEKMFDNKNIGRILDKDPNMFADEIIGIAKKGFTPEIIEYDFKDTLNAYLELIQ